MLKIHRYLIILHFTVIYALGVVMSFVCCMIEILYNGAHLFLVFSDVAQVV